MLARKGCGSVRGSDDDALPCPRLTASGGSNVSTDDGSGCDDGTAAAAAAAAATAWGGAGAPGATFSCDASDEGAMALIDTRHGGTALRHITRERQRAEAESSVVRRTDRKRDNALNRTENS